MGENIYEGVERGRERTEAFGEKHPEFAEMKQAASEEIRAKRAEMEEKTRKHRQTVHGRELERREDLARRRAELEEKLDRMAGNLVQKRITKAYPQLRSGRNYGESFRKLNDRIDALKEKKKAAKAVRKEAKRDDKQ